MRQLSDPDWKKGPTYDKPTDSAHELDPASACIDIDGVGVDEAEKVNGTPICTTMEQFICLRDMCDAAEKRRHIYVVEDVYPVTIDRIEQDIGWTDDPTEDDVIEYIAENCKVVDYGEGPILGFDDGSVEDMYLEARLTITDEAHGACYGEHEPSPEPYGL